jgi:hypothetical protein
MMPAAALLLFLAQVNNWSAVTAIAPGTEVRVVAAAQKIQGRLARSTENSLVVLSQSGEQVFDRPAVTRVSVKKPSHRRRNVLIGLGVGSGAGLGLGLAALPGPNQWHLVPDGAVVVTGIIFGAGVGTAVGALIPTGGWRVVYK